jgi:hypothetical protein
MKPEGPIFPRHETESKEVGGGPGQPHQGVAPVDPWARHPMVWSPWSTSDTALPPIRSLRRENPKSIGVSPGKVLQRRHHRRPILGDKSLYVGHCAITTSLAGPSSPDLVYLMLGALDQRD